MAKFPIEPILKQAMGEDRDGDSFRSACSMLESMCSAGRTEAAVFLYGLFIANRDDVVRREHVVEALGRVKTAETAALLFGELNRIESSTATRRYIDGILDALRHLPLALTEKGLEDLIHDRKWSYRMKSKFKDLLEYLNYQQRGISPLTRAIPGWDLKEELDESPSS